ncbi:MAG: hypothetical protein ABR955_11325 [Verrucomicrobiota bacterium]
MTVLVDGQRAAAPGLKSRNKGGGSDIAAVLQNDCNRAAIMYGLWKKSLAFCLDFKTIAAQF